MSAPEVANVRFNLNAPEFCPSNPPSSGSRFAFLNEPDVRSGRQRSGSYSSRHRSQSLSIPLEPKKPVYRVKISNFCPDFDKCGFVEMMNTMFNDIRSIDFQPRYNEKGRLFGFITFESENGYTKLLAMDRFVFGDDELRVESGQDRKSMPTSTTLVVTHVPLSLPQEDFKQWLEKQSIQPLSFTYHHSAHGFTGTVFVQYRNIEDAGIAWGCLKDSILSGVPVTIEFKRRTDRREFDAENRPVFLSMVAKRLWEQLHQFKAEFVRKNAGVVPSLVFPIDLSPVEKSIVYTYTEKLGLCHYTSEYGDTKMIMVSNTPPGAQTATRKSRAGSVDMPRRPRRMSC